MILSLFSRPTRNGVLDPHAFYRSTVRILGAHLRQLGVERKEDLEDVMQETYVQALKSLPSLKHDEASVAWLLTIGRRQLFRQRERHARRRAEALSPTGTAEDIASDAAPADEQLQATGVCARIVGMIERIEDPRRRDAVQRFYLAEASLQEISIAMDVKVSTLTTWMSRFRESAKQEMNIVTAPQSHQQISPAFAIAKRSRS